MSLSSIYTELHRRAKDTGQDRAIDLKGGARIAVRVQANVTTLTISRANKKVGATEIEVFKRDCGVPSSAIRFPMEEQGRHEHDGALWHYVAYRWRDVE